MNPVGARGRAGGLAHKDFSNEVRRKTELWHVILGSRGVGWEFHWLCGCGTLGDELPAEVFLSVGAGALGRDVKRGVENPLVLLVGVRLKVGSVDEELLLSLLRAELPNDPEATVCKLRGYQFVANTAGTADSSVEAADSSLEVSKLRG